jgi:resuscitation-promoting factor RpfA
MSASGRNSGTPGGAERDPRLDRLYRETGREEPPERLDAAILAAARREVGARPRAISARLRAWRVPVSIAAVVVVSASLVTLVREEGGGELELPSTSDRFSKPAATVPAPPAAREAAKTPASPKPSAAGPAARDDAAAGATSSAKLAEETLLRKQRAADVPAERRAASESRVPARAAAPSPQPFESVPAAREQHPALSTDQAAGTGMATQSLGVRGGELESSAAPAEPAAEQPRAAARMMQRNRADSAAGAMSAAPPPAAVAPAAKPVAKAESRAMRDERQPAPSARVAALLKELDSQPAEKWLEKIDALIREGRKDDADEMLAEFKRRFPGHPLPPGMR